MKPYRALAALVLGLLPAACGNSQPPRISPLTVVPLDRRSVQIPEQAVFVPGGGAGVVARSPSVLQGTVTDNAAVGNPQLRMNAVQCVCGRLESCSAFRSLPRRERTLGLLLNPQTDLFEVTVQFLLGDPDLLDPSPACGALDDPARLRVRYDLQITAEDPPDQGRPAGRRVTAAYALVFDPPQGAADAEPPVLSFFSPTRTDLDATLTTTPFAPRSASQLLQAVLRDNAGEPGRIRVGLCAPGDAGHPPRTRYCSTEVLARCAANPDVFPRGCSCKAVPPTLCPSGFAIDDEVRLETDRLLLDGQLLLNFRQFGPEELLFDPALGEEGGFQACVGKSGSRCNRAFIEAEDRAGNPLDLNNQDLYPGGAQPDPTRLVFEAEPAFTQEPDTLGPAMVVTRTVPPLGNVGRAFLDDSFTLRVEGTVGDETGFADMELFEARGEKLCRVDCVEEVADVPAPDPACVEPSSAARRVFNVSPEGIFRCAFKNLAPPQIRVLRATDVIGNRSGIVIESVQQFDDDLTPRNVAVPSGLDVQDPALLTRFPLAGNRVSPNDPSFRFDVSAGDAVAIYRAEIRLNDEPAVPLPASAFIPTVIVGSVLVRQATIQLSPAQLLCEEPCDAACRAERKCLGRIANDGDKYALRLYDRIERFQESVYAFTDPNEARTEFTVAVADNVLETAD